MGMGMGMGRGNRGGFQQGYESWSQTCHTGSSITKTISSVGVGNVGKDVDGKGLLPVPTHLYAGQPLVANFLTVATFANIVNVDNNANIANFVSHEQCQQ